MLPRRFELRIFVALWILPLRKKYHNCTVSTAHKELSVLQCRWKVMGKKSVELGKTDFHVENLLLSVRLVRHMHKILDLWRVDLLVLWCEKHTRYLARLLQRTNARNDFQIATEGSNVLHLFLVHHNACIIKCMLVQYLPPSTCAHKPLKMNHSSTPLQIQLVQNTS